MPRVQLLLFYKNNICIKTQPRLCKIGDKTFVDCENITEIVIPNSIVSIGEYCFDGCDGLSFLGIPESVIDFGYSFLGGIKLDYFICHGKKYTDMHKINEDFSQTVWRDYEADREAIINFPKYY